MNKGKRRQLSYTAGNCKVCPQPTPWSLCPNDDYQSSGWRYWNYRVLSCLSPLWFKPWFFCVTWAMISKENGIKLLQRTAPKALSLLELIETSLREKNKKIKILVSKRIKQARRTHTGNWKCLTMEESYNSSMSVKMGHSSRYCLKQLTLQGFLFSSCLTPKVKNCHVISSFTGNTIDQKWKKKKKKPAIKWSLNLKLHSRGNLYKSSCQGRVRQGCKIRQTQSSSAVTALAHHGSFSCGS